MVIIISKRKTHTEFIEELKNKNPNIEVLDNYINAITKIKCKCKTCNKILYMTPNSLLSGNGCYDCNMGTHVQKITKTHDQFITDLNNKNNAVIILGKYKNSKTNILTECKKCSYVWNANPSSLLSGTQCPKCAGTMHKTHEYFVKDLKRINPNITILGKYINSKSKILCRCNTCNSEWKTTPDALINSKTGCPNCNGGIKKTHDNFLQRMNNINPNINILGSYKNTSTKILCHCKICSHEWEALPNSLLKNHGCPKCNIERKKKTHDEFINEISVINPNITILDKYSGINSKILCKCNICEYKWNPVPDSLLHGHGCPRCNKSRGEKNIENYLKTRKIYNVPQKTFYGLIGVNGGNLSYDFYLPNYNLLIEFQGIQHEKPIDFKSEGKEKSKENFKIQQEHDRRKREYAKLHNIDLLEIWYYDLDNIDEILYKYLLNKSA